MSFPGPGLYEIIPYQAPKLSLNSWNGLLEAGAQVKTFARDNPPTPTSNAVWQISAASGSGPNTQYLITNGRTGYPITATAPNTIVSTPQISPSSLSARWIITPAFTNGYQVYTINCVETTLGQLNVAGSGVVPGTDILAWPISNTDNTKFYFDAVKI
jgi:hypothetical protein